MHLSKKHAAFPKSRNRTAFTSGLPGQNYKNFGICNSFLNVKKEIKTLIDQSNSRDMIK
jgi:hypothetical protein